MAWGLVLSTKAPRASSIRFEVDDDAEDPTGVDVFNGGSIEQVGAETMKCEESGCTQEAHYRRVSTGDDWRCFLFVCFFHIGSDRSKYNFVPIEPEKELRK
jgi:hypothetical protein